MSAVVDKLYPATQLALPAATQPPSATVDASLGSAATSGVEAAGVVMDQVSTIAVDAVLANGHSGTPSASESNATAAAGTGEAVANTGGRTGGSGDDSTAAGQRPPPRIDVVSKVRPPRRKTRGDAGGAAPVGDVAGASGCAAVELVGWIERAARADSGGGGGGVGGVSGDGDSETGEEEEEGEFVPVGEEMDDETTLDAEVSVVTPNNEAVLI